MMVGGRVVFQLWCAGEPAFIRMNQRGDKISPVTEQGYEIRELIEFSSPGQGCGALNIIEFDRLMKRAPMLVPLLSIGLGESWPPQPYADVQRTCLLSFAQEKDGFSRHSPNVYSDYAGRAVLFSVSVHLIMC